MNEEKINPVSGFLNKISNTNLNSWMHYGLLLLAFAIFVLLELITIGFDTSFYKQSVFWIKVLTNEGLLVMIMVPMLLEGENAGLKTTAYQTMANNLEHLLTKIREYGHNVKFSAFLRKYNQETFLERLDAYTVSTFDITLRNDKGNFEKQAYKNLLQNKTLTRKDKQKIQAFRSKFFKKEMISAPDFYTTLSAKTGKQEVKIERTKIRVRLIATKVIISTVGFAFLTFILWDSFKDLSWLTVALILGKLFNILFNVTFTFKNGKRITAELIPLVYNNRINIIKKFAIHYGYYEEYEIARPQKDQIENPDSEYEKEKEQSLPLVVEE